MKHILKCQSCGNWTLKSLCPKCGEKSIMPKPPKFSLEDKYGNYRRKVKAQALKEKGLL